ncbi:MAG: hypothetical protein V3T83_15660, partial [Acidobacteriota bacterium]
MPDADRSLYTHSLAGMLAGQLDQADAPLDTGEFEGDEERPDASEWESLLTSLRLLKADALSTARVHPGREAPA